MQFDDGQILSKTEQIVESDMDGEVIILHVESGEIAGLSDTSAFIWNELKDPITYGDLISTVQETYDVDYETCVNDVSACLAELVTLNIIAVTPTTGG